MMDDKEVMRALVELRNHMGMSQSTFAVNVLGKTLPTQQRYERLVPPPAPELVALVVTARQNSFGALLRSAFLCVVKKTAATQWSLVEPCVIVSQ